MNIERVTLGVVGDCDVGKTCLVTSYTSNYVCREYRPTVLDMHWTILRVDDVIVDLRVWDNSGSVSILYSPVMSFHIKVFIGFV